MDWEFIRVDLFAEVERPAFLCVIYTAICLSVVLDEQAVVGY